MDPIKTRLTAIEQIVEDDDDVTAYEWAKINQQSNRYGVCIRASEVPRSYLRLMEDQHTQISHVKSRRPVSIRVRVEPNAVLDWDYEHLLQND